MTAFRGGGRSNGRHGQRNDVPRAAHDSCARFPGLRSSPLAWRCWPCCRAVVTYALLTGLTPYTPDHTGLILLPGQPDAGPDAGGADRLAAGAAVGRAPIGPRRRPAACAAGDLVLRHRGGARHPGGGVRVGDPQPGPGCDVLRPGEGALGSAVNVAQVYVKEHEASILGDIRYIADAIQRDPGLFDEDHHVRAGLLFAKLGTVTQNRGLQASYILDGKGHVLVHAPSSSH